MKNTKQEMLSNEELSHVKGGSSLVIPSPTIGIRIGLYIAKKLFN